MSQYVPPVNNFYLLVWINLVYLPKLKRKKMDITQDKVTINGKTYILEGSQGQIEHVGDLKIVILQRGWIMVGKLEKNGSDCKLHNASVIRTWGTTKGLGELANDGPKSSTKLDPCHGVVEFHELTIVATLACNKNNWK